MSDQMLKDVQAELASRYEIRYGSDLSALVQSVNTMNEHALDRDHKPFRIVTILRDGDRWASY